MDKLFEIMKHVTEMDIYLMLFRWLGISLFVCMILSWLHPLASLCWSLIPGAVMAIWMTYYSIRERIDKGGE